MTIRKWVCSRYVLTCIELHISLGRSLISYINHNFSLFFYFTSHVIHSALLSFDKNIFFFYLLESTKGVGVEYSKIFLEKISNLFTFFITLKQISYRRLWFDDSLIGVTHVYSIPRESARELIFWQVKLFQLEPAEEFFDPHFLTTRQTTHELRLSRI